MEENYLTLRKNKSNLYTKITTESFKDSLNQFSLSLRKQKINDLIMSKRKIKKVELNNIFQFNSNNNQINKIDSNSEFEIKVFNFDDIIKQNDIINRIILFQEYITYVLHEKIDIHFYESYSDFINQNLEKDFPIILFDKSNKYSTEIKTKILYLYILFIHQDISLKIINLYLDNHFLSQLNQFINRIYLQKELSLILITLCNFLIVNLLQYDKYSYRKIVNSINVEFMINVTINRIFSFNEHEITSNFNPTEKMFIVLVLLIRNYLFNMQENESEKYFDMCQKICYILKTLIKKHPNQIYMIYETINLFRLCKINDYINDNEINLIFQNILEKCSNSFNYCNLGILLVTLFTVYKELKSCLSKNGEYINDNNTNDSDENEIDSEIDIEVENIFLLKEEVLCFVSRIFVTYFNEFLKRKKEFEENINILIYSIKIISIFYLKSSYFPNINNRLKEILISNDNDNISFTEILKICYSLSIEQKKLYSLTKSILYFFQIIFRKNDNEHHLIKKYFISNNIEIHSFIGRTLSKIISDNDITYYILEIIQNILYFSNKRAEIDNIKFDLKKIGFDELISNLQLNSYCKDIRGICYEILREYFDKEIINDDYFEYYPSEEY